ncbi:MAG: DUF1643 domain-containing protein [Oscillospiraceae bacterium]
MITEKNSITNEVVYSDDKAHRYLLSRIWDSEKSIPMIITKNSGKADGVFIDLTTNIMSNNLYKLGYGGFYAVNLCSAIDNAGSSSFDKTTDDIIKKYAKLCTEIIIAYGYLTTKPMQARERDVLDILKKSGKKLLAVCDNNGQINIHPLTPSVRRKFILVEFDANIKPKMNKN